jgi:2-iminobutanoate/2-iminopropanoate deaminase
VTGFSAVQTFLSRLRVAPTVPQFHSAPAAPPEEQAYSHAVEANGFLFTAGQIPMTPSGNLLEGSVAEKTRRIMANLETILAETDRGFEDVVKTTAYFTDIEDFPEMDETYATYFEGAYPARDVVEVDALPAGASIELVMTAATGQ